MKQLPESNNRWFITCSPWIQGEIRASNESSVKWEAWSLAGRARSLPVCPPFPTAWSKQPLQLSPRDLGLQFALPAEPGGDKGQLGTCGSEETNSLGH